MNEIFIFILKAKDGSIFREYVENVMKIDKELALKRFEKAIKKHECFYLKDSDRYIVVKNIISIEIEILEKNKGE